MPCKLWVSVLAARDLPIMDTKGKNRSTDAFVEVFVPGSKKKISKTDICKRTLNPVWNSKLGSEMEFEIVDDAKLQDSPVQFKVKDKNIMTEDFIGVVRVDMGASMADDSRHAEVSGWFPIWDTLRGLSGELRIRLRLEHIIDRNKFDGSVSGIKFFASSALSPNVSVEIVGFVEELVVEEDPEFSWADQLRSARKSNEKRIKRLHTHTDYTQVWDATQFWDTDNTLILKEIRVWCLEDTARHVVYETSQMMISLQYRQTRKRRTIITIHDNESLH